MKAYKEWGLTNMKNSKLSIHSILFKICMIINVAVIATGLIMVLTYSPNVKKEISTLCEHYIGDLADIVLNCR